MFRPNRAFWVGAVALLLVTPAVYPQSQATTGLIQGRSTDESGSVLPGVTVTLTNTATNFEKVVITDENGRFRAPLMPLGPYRITAGLEGFATLVREGLELPLGGQINLDLDMQIAQVEQEIVVTGAAPLIETTRSEGQVRIDDAAVEGLPNDGRNFLEFVKLTPGATIVQGPDGDELSITGQKGINNNIMIDGADYNNPFFGEQRGGQRPAFTFNQDAVKEVLVITDGAPAEYGRSSGGFVSVVTKSGTNQLKWTGHVFYQDDGLSESPKLQSGGRESAFAFDRTQLGFTLGGPLKQDKAFFFVAADVQDKDETKQTNGGRIPADVVAFLDSVGLPNENAPVTRTDDGDAYLAKLDVLINDQNLLTGRWAYHYSQQVNGTFDVDSWGVSANGVETDYAHGYTTTLLSTISPTLLNEFRGQYAKEWRPRPYSGPQVPGQNRPFPDTGFDFAGRYRVGMPFFLPVEYDDDRLQINNNLSWLKGDHSIKAGLEYNDVTSSQTFIGFANGRYIFSSVEGFRNYVNIGPSYVECWDGSSSNVGFCPPNPDPTQQTHVGPLLFYLQFAGVGGISVNEGGTQSIEQKETALFVQDSWQPRSNLTLDFGLRWEGLDNPEPLTPASQVHYAPLIGQTRDSPLGPQTFPSDGTIPDDNDQFQPRFALSWTPKNSNSGVLRFNSGIFNARVPALTLAGPRNTNGSINQNLFRASFFHDFGIGFLLPTWPNILDVSNAGDPVNPGVRVFDKDFQTPRTWSTAISWEQELIPDYSFLFKVNYAKTDHLTRFINRNDPQLGGIWSGGPGGVGELATTESAARSRYMGYTVGVNKRYAKNFAMQAYYTYSKDESDDDNERDPFTFRYASLANLGPEYGLSDRNQDHRFNAWILWTAPHGIDFNTRVSFLSAQPLDIRPDGQRVSGFPPTERCIPSPGAAAPPCAIDAQVFQRNQGEKNNEFLTLDFRLSRNFDVGGWTFQPIIDVFNISDEENFLTPEAVNLLFNFDGTIRSGSGSPRTVQVGVRLLN